MRAALDRTRGNLGVADIALDERVTRVAGNIGDIGLAGCVGHLVEIDDLDVRAALHDEADEMAADEAAAAGYENAHNLLPAK